MGKLGTYNSGQLLNPMGHLLLWFHGSGKKALRKKELTSSQLFFGSSELQLLSRECEPEMTGWQPILLL